MIWKFWISVKKNQEQNVKLNETRILFDNLMVKNPHLDYYWSSGSNGEPVLNKASAFELAVCKSQEGTVLKNSEKNIQEF